MFFLDFGSGKSGFIGVAFSFFAGTAMKRDSSAPEAGIAKDFARDKARLCIDYLMNSELPWGLWELEL